MMTPRERLLLTLQGKLADQVPVSPFVQEQYLSWYYPDRLSVTIICTLANAFPTEPAIRGDEGTITLQGPVWELGFDSVTVIPRKGTPTKMTGDKSDSVLAHWRNFLDCVRSREKPVADVEFGYRVQVALNMAMLSYLNKKVAVYDTRKEEIVLS